MVSVFKELIKVLFASVKPKSNIGFEKYTVSAATVAEPIFSFVNTVKANPERFTFEGVVNSRWAVDGENSCSSEEGGLRKFKDDNHGEYTDRYLFTDSKLELSWVILVYNEEAYSNGYSRAGRYPTQPNYLICNDEKARFVTQLEWLFIEEQLYLPFLKRREVLAEAKQRRDTKRHERSCKIARAFHEATLKAQRNAYKEAYCKEEVK